MLAFISAETPSSQLFPVSQSAESELNRIFAGKEKAGSSPHPPVSLQTDHVYTLYFKKGVEGNTNRQILFSYPSLYITKIQYQCES